MRKRLLPFVQKQGAAVHYIHTTPTYLPVLDFGLPAHQDLRASQHFPSSVLSLLQWHDDCSSSGAFREAFVGMSTETGLTF